MCNVWSIPLKEAIEVFFRWLARPLWEEMKPSPQFTLPEAKDWLCKAQYNACCEWVCILCLCECECVCCESHLISAGLHSLWGCIGMLYHWEVWDYSAGRGLNPVCACMCVQHRCFLGFPCIFSSLPSCMLCLSSEWLTDQRPAAFLLISNRGLAVSAIGCMVFVAIYCINSIKQLWKYWGDNVSAAVSLCNSFLSRKWLSRTNGDMYADNHLDVYNKKRKCFFYSARMY